MSTGASEGLRVVLDTNVLIAAFTQLRPGISFQIWEMAINRRYRLLTSPPLVTEAADVLRRKFSWQEDRILRRIKFLVRTAELVAPKFTMHVVPFDEDDNRILECAVAGKADLIVSGDRHLRKLKSYEGIGVVTPTDFLRMFGG